MDAALLDTLKKDERFREIIMRRENASPETLDAVVNAKFEHVKRAAFEVAAMQNLFPVPGQTPEQKYQKFHDALLTKLESDKDKGINDSLLRQTLAEQIANVAMKQAGGDQPPVQRNDAYKRLVREEVEVAYAAQKDAMIGEAIKESKHVANEALQRLFRAHWVEGALKHAGAKETGKEFKENVNHKLDGVAGAVGRQSVALIDQAALGDSVTKAFTKVLEDKAVFTASTLVQQTKIETALRKELSENFTAIFPNLPATSIGYVDNVGNDIKEIIVNEIATKATARIIDKESAPNLDLGFTESEKFGLGFAASTGLLVLRKVAAAPFYLLTGNENLSDAIRGVSTKPGGSKGWLQDRLDVLRGVRESVANAPVDVANFWTGGQVNASLQNTRAHGVLRDAGVPAELRPSFVEAYNAAVRETAGEPLMGNEALGQRLRPVTTRGLNWVSTGVIDPQQLSLPAEESMKMLNAYEQKYRQARVARIQADHATTKPGEVPLTNEEATQLLEQQEAVNKETRARKLMESSGGTSSLSQEQAMAQVAQQDLAARQAMARDLFKHQLDLNLRFDKAALGSTNVFRLSFIQSSKPNAMDKATANYARTEVFSQNEAAIERYLDAHYARQEQVQMGKDAGAPPELPQLPAAEQLREEMVRVRDARRAGQQPPPINVFGGYDPAGTTPSNAASDRSRYQRLPGVVQEAVQRKLQLVTAPPAAAREALARLYRDKQEAFAMVSPADLQQGIADVNAARSAAGTAGDMTPDELKAAIEQRTQNRQKALLAYAQEHGLSGGYAPNGAVSLIAPDSKKILVQGENGVFLTPDGKDVTPAELERLIKVQPELAGLIEAQPATFTPEVISQNRQLQVNQVLQDSWIPAEVRTTLRDSYNALPDAAKAGLKPKQLRDAAAAFELAKGRGESPNMRLMLESLVAPEVLVRPARGATPTGPGIPGLLPFGMGDLLGLDPARGEYGGVRVQPMRGPGPQLMPERGPELERRMGQQLELFHQRAAKVTDAETARRIREALPPTEAYARHMFGALGSAEKVAIIEDFARHYTATGSPDTSVKGMVALLTQGDSSSAGIKNRLSSYFTMMLNHDGFFDKLASPNKVNNAAEHWNTPGKERMATADIPLHELFPYDTGVRVSAGQQFSIPLNTAIQFGQNHTLRVKSMEGSMVTLEHYDQGGKKSTITHDFSKGAFTFGRGEGNTLVVADDYVSGRHGSLQLEGGKLQYVHSGRNTVQLEVYNAMRAVNPLQYVVDGAAIASVAPASAAPGEAPAKPAVPQPPTNAKALNPGTTTVDLGADRGQLILHDTGTKVNAIYVHPDGTRSPVFERELTAGETFKFGRESSSGEPAQRMSVAGPQVLSRNTADITRGPNGELIFTNNTEKAVSFLERPAAPRAPVDLPPLRGRAHGLDGRAVDPKRPDLLPQAVPDADGRMEPRRVEPKPMRVVIDGVLPQPAQAAAPAPQDHLGSGRPIPPSPPSAPRPKVTGVSRQYGPGVMASVGSLIGFRGAAEAQTPEERAANVALGVVGAAAALPQMPGALRLPSVPGISGAAEKLLTPMMLGMGGTEFVQGVTDRNPAQALRGSALMVGAAPGTQAVAARVVLGKEAAAKLLAKQATSRGVGGILARLAGPTGGVMLVHDAADTWKHHFADLVMGKVTPEQEAGFWTSGTVKGFRENYEAVAQHNLSLVKPGDIRPNHIFYEVATPSVTHYHELSKHKHMFLKNPEEVAAGKLPVFENDPEKISKILARKRVELDRPIAEKRKLVKDHTGYGDEIFTTAGLESALESSWTQIRHGKWAEDAKQFASRIMSEVEEVKQLEARRNSLDAAAAKEVGLGQDRDRSGMAYRAQQQRRNGMAERDPELKGICDTISRELEQHGDVKRAYLAVQDALEQRQKRQLEALANRQTAYLQGKDARGAVELLNENARLAEELGLSREAAAMFFVTSVTLDAMDKMVGPDGKPMRVRESLMLDAKHLTAEFLARADKAGAISFTETELVIDRDKAGGNWERVERQLKAQGIAYDATEPGKIRIAHGALHLPDSGLGGPNGLDVFLKHDGHWQLQDPTVSPDDPASRVIFTPQGTGTDVMNRMRFLQAQGLQIEFDAANDTATVPFAQVAPFLAAHDAGNLRAAHNATVGAMRRQREEELDAPARALREATQAELHKHTGPFSNLLNGTVKEGSVITVPDMPPDYPKGGMPSPNYYAELPDRKPVTIVKSSRIVTQGRRGPEETAVLTFRAGDKEYVAVFEVKSGGPNGSSTSKYHLELIDLCHRNAKGEKTTLSLPQDRVYDPDRLDHLLSRLSADAKQGLARTQRESAVASDAVRDTLPGLGRSFDDHAATLPAMPDADRQPIAQPAAGLNGATPPQAGASAPTPANGTAPAEPAPPQPITLSQGPRPEHTAAVALADALVQGKPPEEITALINSMNGRPTTPDERRAITTTARANLEGRRPRPDTALAVLEFHAPANEAAVAAARGTSLPRMVIDNGRGGPSVA